MLGGDPNTFTGSGGLDRAGDLREDDAWVARASEDGLVVIAGAGGVALHERRPVLLALADVDASEVVLLGVRPEDGRALFAVEEPAGSGRELTGLRDVAATLSQDDAGVLAYASAMLAWHRSCCFCGRCGARTASVEAGFSRLCENGHTHHPRTDPVVIAIVVDADRDRVLLGRQPTWPAGRYSALAGFVEPGESLEAAVAREVHEEAGVRVDVVNYVSSQPWPFPGSLMLGFTAGYAEGEPFARDGELEDVRWFSRAEVREAATQDGWWKVEAQDDAEVGLHLPPRVAIARRLLEGWLIS